MTPTGVVGPTVPPRSARPSRDPGSNGAKELKAMVRPELMQRLAGPTVQHPLAHRSSRYNGQPGATGHMAGTFRSAELSCLVGPSGLNGPTGMIC